MMIVFWLESPRERWLQRGWSLSRLWKVGDESKNDSLSDSPTKRPSQGVLNKDVHLLLYAKQTHKSSRRR